VSIGCERAYVGLGDQRGHRYAVRTFRKSWELLDVPRFHPEPQHKENTGKPKAGKHLMSCYAFNFFAEK